VLIAKMDDGSCNHMTCALCGSEFCWLCMKEISDLHYLSPSGCTFWGKKPWSRKKKILWQLGTLVGAPVGIALLAGIAVPAMIIGIPIWVGRKLYARFKTVSKHKRNIIITSGVAASVRVEPEICFQTFFFFRLLGRMWVDCAGRYRIKTKVYLTFLFYFNSINFHHKRDRREKATRNKRRKGETIGSGKVGM
jgi:hypothetical protein